MLLYLIYVSIRNFSTLGSSVSCLVYLIHVPITKVQHSNSLHNIPWTSALVRESYSVKGRIIQIPALHVASNSYHQPRHIWSKSR